MTADQTGGNAPEEKPRAPYLKLKARESLGDDAKGTGTWSILKDMKISLVDGGVSILKQGLSKLTGAFSGRDLPKADDLAPTPVNRGTQTDGAIGAQQLTVDGGGTAPAVVGSPGSQEETSAFGFDWVDNLLEELDASHPIPDEVSNPPVAAVADLSSRDETPLFPGV